MMLSEVFNTSSAIKVVSTSGKELLFPKSSDVVMLELSIFTGS